MGRRIQKNTKDHKRSNRVQQRDNKASRSNKKSKSQDSKTPPKNLSNILGKTVKRFAPFLKCSFQSLDDTRHQSYVVYKTPHLIWSGILMFLLLLESRKQYRNEKRTDKFLKNLLKLSQTNEDTSCDPDTINNFLKTLHPSALESIPAKLVNYLIRIKTLDYYRLHGNFLIAIDGTGIRKYNKRHCEHCLTKTDSKTKTTTYYHNVLEAKLITKNGFSFSIATEFILNPHKFPNKQDCEFNAFKRLAPKIRKYFPRLKICLLMDALYSNAPVFEICEKYQWKYIVNFKNGNLPVFFKKMWELKQKNTDNRKTIKSNGITQTFSWINNQKYQDKYLMNVFYCHEINKKKNKITDYAWLTNIHELNHNNISKIANEGARARWNIEEAFNIQKNGGYNLEHSYSNNNNASENWYYLMQIAHALNQLMTKSNLFNDFTRQMGSLKNFAKRLAEHLRFILIEPDICNQQFQIRFNSS